jgi:hypothetical protein
VEVSALLAEDEEKKAEVSALLAEVSFGVEDADEEVVDLDSLYTREYFAHCC